MIVTLFDCHETGPLLFSSQLSGDVKIRLSSSWNIKLLDIFRGSGKSDISSQVHRCCCYKGVYSKNENWLLSGKMIANCHQWHVLFSFCMCQGLILRIISIEILLLLQQQHSPFLDNVDDDLHNPICSRRKSPPPNSIYAICTLF